MLATFSFESRLELCTERITVRMHAGARNAISTRVASVAHLLVNAARVFMGAVAFGQSLFAAWDWCNHIGLLW